MKNILDVKIIRSDGAIIMCGEEQEWGILKIEGLGAAEVEVFKENKGFGNGSFITGKRTASREINIECKGRSSLIGVSESRQKIVGFFSSEYTYTVEISLYGRTVRTPVGCELINCNIPTEKGLRTSTASWSVSLECPEPYFASKENVVKGVSATIPAWGFPAMHVQGTERYTTGYFEVAELKSIYYNGTAPAPINFTLYALNVADKLVLTLNRGDGKRLTFEIIDNFATGDVITIDVRNSVVKKNGGNIDIVKYFGTIEALPELCLTYGDNSFSVVNSENQKSFDGSIAYYAEYNGV